MKAQLLLDKLDKVRQTASGKWVACCPAHADKTPSLAIAEGDDGRVLIKCFAECAPLDILRAVGMSFEDLFPERLPDQHYKPIRKPFPAASVLEGLRTEVMVVWLASCDMAKGRTLTEEHRQRLNVAASRIEVAIDG